SPRRSPRRRGALRRPPAPRAPPPRRRASGWRTARRRTLPATRPRTATSSTGRRGSSRRDGINARCVVSLLAVPETHDTTEAKLRWLEELREQSLEAAGEKAVARQRERGKLLARERLEKLLDPGSFVELDRFVRHREIEFGMRDQRPWGDAVVTGHGT